MYLWMITLKSKKKKVTMKYEQKEQSKKKK
jgi:hypothetical protein